MTVETARSDRNFVDPSKRRTASSARARFNDGEPALRDVLAFVRLHDAATVQARMPGASSTSSEFTRGAPASKWANRARMGLLVAMVAMAALHAVQSGRNVPQEPVSFYVHGAYGWLLPVALAAFAGAALALGQAVLTGPTGDGRAGPWLAWFGAGMLIDAIVPSDLWFPWEAPPTFSGAVHEFAAVVAPPLLLGAMYRLGSGRSAAALAPRGTLNLCAAGYVVGLLGSAASLVIGFVLDRAPPFVGVLERLLAISAVGWLAVVAARLRRGAVHSEGAHTAAIEFRESSG